LGNAAYDYSIIIRKVKMLFQKNPAVFTTGLTYSPIEKFVD